MNTKIFYMYRDASNYKESEEIILEGSLTKKQITNIKSKLDQKEFFIPSQVGLTDLQDRMINFPNEDDHVWHELCEISSTNESSNSELTAKQLYKNVMKVTWDEIKAMKDIGL